MPSRCRWCGAGPGIRRGPPRIGNAPGQILAVWPACGGLSQIGDSNCKRNGTTTLFAALEVAHEMVLGQCYARHRHQEVTTFLHRLYTALPAEITLLVVMDNYGTHEHPRGPRWPKLHERFIPRFVPTSSSWLTLVERWFGELTGKHERKNSSRL
jgi:hypothetical protein